MSREAIEIGKGLEELHQQEIQKIAFKIWESFHPDLRDIPSLSDAETNWKRAEILWRENRG